MIVSPLATSAACPARCCQPRTPQQRGYGGKAKSPLMLFTHSQTKLSVPTAQQVPASAATPLKPSHILQMLLAGQDGKQHLVFWQLQQTLLTSVRGEPLFFRLWNFDLVE